MLTGSIYDASASSFVFDFFAGSYSGIGTLVATRIALQSKPLSPVA